MQDFIDFDKPLILMCSQSVSKIALYIEIDITLSHILCQEWMDHKLKWDPEEYGGVSQLYVPAEEIWLPDIVLYNK